MNMTRSTPYSVKSVLAKFVGWVLLLSLVIVIRTKISIDTLKDRLGKN